jgi:alkaline phosphatase
MFFSQFVDADYWKHIAELEIEATKKVLNAINTNTAKNIIIFVGDGMSLPTLTASRIYKAQYEARKKGQTANGEESLLTFEKFPHVGLSKVKYHVQYTCN